ncbi:uncharacterized protein cubi_00098 [Cryptosporidium ubiquitum]|uniref:Uncharacterized protein n=1 Tax=Cryptosporidium ubiquitum TaxID=857276 RepID=A0A1J4MJY6_9CRYT|nr:uncharacterized protein cubi_00098 [Cryptosporidium ubiquitum]OII74545.1 hypothetical protein cubi_00098 [Cryptosporidium ubiquitum]
MNDLDDSTFRFYTSPEDRNDLVNYRSSLSNFNHDEFMLQSTARQSGYVVNSYIHGRAASEYSCSSGSFRDLNSSAEQTTFERSLSPVNRTLDTTTSEVSTIPSARSIVERTRRGRSPSLSYTVTTLQAQRGIQQTIKGLVNNNNNIGWNNNQLISSNDRNPLSILTMKSIDLNPPCLSEDNFKRTRVINNAVLNGPGENKNYTNKTARSSLCTFFNLCNCFGPRVKDTHNL